MAHSVPGENVIMEELLKCLISERISVATFLLLGQA